MKGINLAEILVFFAIWTLSVHSQVSLPALGAIWLQGESETITWQGISGAPLCIVLTRPNTVFHNTITCTAQSSGSVAWTVALPAQDGWPSSTSTEIVYRLDFYTGGGWNLGGTLVASSVQFAIVYSGGNNPPPPGPGTTTVITSPAGGGYITITQTKVIVGVITTTQYITQVVQVSTVNPTGTAIVVQPTMGLTTITITNTNQLSTITQISTTGVNTVTTTTFVGALTITGQTRQQQLFNSAARKGALTLPVAGILLMALMGAMLVFG